MQLIFFLFVLFTIGCLFYGISAGVQTMQRGVARLAGNKYGNAATATQPMPSTAQRCLHELQELHSLYQQGALSKDEFEQLKHGLLSAIIPIVFHLNQETL